MVKSKSKSKTRLSNIHKPVAMSLVEWQVALRRQQAQKEALAVSGTAGEYLVRNPHTRNEYEVFYYGLGNPLNGCSCMDFKTSRIGTCKHIEAVRQWLGTKSPNLPDGTKTVLYMDYSSAPRPAIKYGTDGAVLLKALFKGMFRRDGLLEWAEAPNLLQAIREADQSGVPFICRPDAMDFALSCKDAADRKVRMDTVFARKEWWKNFFLEGVKPFPYQQEGIEFAARAGRCIIADEMGLGKTIQAVGTAMLLHQEGFVSSVLIVCPTSLKYQWKREIMSYTGIDALVVEGVQPVRCKLYKGPELFKIVSYNALSNDIRAMGGLQTDMVIMDEVQRLKNWDTQIARSARKVHADYSLILSGTPLENKLDELYSIVQLVDQFTLGPYYTFRQEHIVTTDSGKVVGYKGLNEVGAMLGRLLLRRRKVDVAVQLPERMDQNLFVPMTREQMDRHEEFKASVARIVWKWRRMHYLSETDRRRLLTFLSQMRMVCDSTYVLDQQTRFDTKVEETMNILENICESGDDKVVIFSGWERMTRLIAAELDAKGIGYSYLHGGVPSEKRKDIMDRFTEDPSVRVFLSTDAGSTGLNLQAASFIINLDLPWNPAVLEQRIGRIYRIGQKRNIQVINLISTGTIEEQMLLKLKFKSDLFDGVLNGGEDEIFLDNNKLETLVEDLGLSGEPLQEELDMSMPTEGDTQARGHAMQEADTEKRVHTDDILDEYPVLFDDEPSQDITPVSSSSPSELIGQGVAFLGNLLQTLKQPDSARELVDALVKENPDTGQTTLQIPVSGKDKVLDFVTLLGKLLK